MSDELRFDQLTTKKVIEKIVSDELSKWPGALGTEVGFYRLVFNIIYLPVNCLMGLSRRLSVFILKHSQRFISLDCLLSASQVPVRDFRFQISLLLLISFLTSAINALMLF